MFREVGTETNAATTLAHLSCTREHGRSVGPTWAQPGSKDYFLIMGRRMIRPDYKEFLRLSRSATLVPVAKSISADLLTPVSAFLAVADGEPDAFLLESVEGGEKIGRYTFLGVRPFLRLESRGAEIKIERDRKIVRRTGNVFQVIKELLQQHRPAALEGLPPFTAGAVGYCAYDIVRRLERIGERATDDLGVPDCVLMFFDRVLAFDHLRHQIHIVASADVTRETPKAAYTRAVNDIGRIEKKLAAGWKPIDWRKATRSKITQLKVKPRTPKRKFLESVQRAKEYIAAGDIFQVVLSQRWDFEPGVAPLDLYRALRTVNPSPYMFFLRFGGEKLGDKTKHSKKETGAGAMHVLGASPEMLVRVSGSKLEYRPMAGTHPRGKDGAADAALEKKMR